MNETSKAAARRLKNTKFATTYFVGNGIDIGCGPDPVSKFAEEFPAMGTVKPWDLDDGDAQVMAGVPDEAYDFVHSSHCLEHMRDPTEAFANWLRICRPGGYVIITIPDEDLYEQGRFPSTFNRDHKTTWTISKSQSWSPVSINLFNFLGQFGNQIEILKVELINDAFVYDQRRHDQTLLAAECAIEFVVRKRPADELARCGRLPL